ncbi:hypothetical protein, partial [Tropicimonas aquimaris]
APNSKAVPLRMQRRVFQRNSDVSDLRRGCDNIELAAAANCANGGERTLSAGANSKIRLNNSKHEPMLNSGLVAARPHGGYEPQSGLIV